MGNDLALQTGLVSGIDSGQLVEALTARRQETIKIQERKKHELSLSKEEYQSVHSALAALEESAVSLSFESTFSRKNAKVSDEDVLGASATTGAEPASYNVSVNQLATKHRVASNSLSSSTESLTTEDSTIQLNGVSLTVAGGANLQDVKQGINGLKTQTGVGAEIIDNRLVLSSLDTGTENTMEVVDTDGSLLQDIGVLQDATATSFGQADRLGQAFKSVTIGDWQFGPGTMSINGTEVSLGGGETFNEFADIINNAGIEGVTAEGFSTRALIYSEGQDLELEDIDGNNAAILDGMHYEQSGSLGALNLNGKSLFVNGDQIDFTTETTASEVMDRINGADIAGVQASIAPGSNRLRIYADESMPINISGSAATEIGGFASKTPDNPPIVWDYFNDEEEVIDVNGEEVTLQAYSRLTQIRNSINAVAGDSGVMTNIVDDTELNFSASEPIVITDVTGKFGQQTGLSSSAFVNELASAQDATFNINGISATRSSNLINDVVDDITFELKDVGASTVTIENDTDNTRTAIENFIERYNSAIQLVDEKVRAKRDYSLKYLSEDQLSQLSEEDRAKKEEELRKQVLSGDPILQRAYNTLRQFSYQRIDGVEGVNSLSDLGISTGAIGSSPADTRVGTIQIVDEQKFSAALDNNLEEVKTLFTRNDSENSDGVGLAERLKTDIRRFTSFGGLLTQKAGRPGQSVSNSLIDREIASLSLDILNKNRSLLQYQESLLLNFQNMESSLQELQNQQSAIAQAGSSAGAGGV